MRTSTERRQAALEQALRDGAVTEVTGGRRCDRYPCAEPVVVEDKARGDTGTGLDLCLKHWAERNGF